MEDVCARHPLKCRPVIQGEAIDGAFDEVVVVQGNDGGTPDVQDTEQVIQPPRGIGSQRCGLAAGKHRPDSLADPQEPYPVLQVCRRGQVGLVFGQPGRPGLEVPIPELRMRHRAVPVTDRLLDRQAR